MQLKADELTCNRGGREVFRGLNFSLSAGEAMVVTGRNGAGKSSLLRMIAGLVRIAAGRLTLDSNNTDTPIAEQAHYLGHQDAMKPSLSVRENLQFWTEFLGARRTVEPALEVGRSCTARRFAGRLFVGRPTPAAVDCPSCRRATANLVTRRANLFTRCAVPETAGRVDARTFGWWRHDHCRGAWTDRS